MLNHYSFIAIPITKYLCAKTLQDAYIHQPRTWRMGTNDRPLATINYAVKDTLDSLKQK